MIHRPTSIEPNRTGQVENREQIAGQNGSSRRSPKALGLAVSI